MGFSVKYLLVDIVEGEIVESADHWETLVDKGRLSNIYHDLAIVSNDTKKLVGYVVQDKADIAARLGEI